jgi:DNA-binding beta-propeller fold protein YncE
MAKKVKWLAALSAGIIICTGVSVPIFGQAAAAQGAAASKFPTFELDTTWPKLPNDWVLGNVAKIVADRHDNIWIIHRPRTVPAGKKAAPAIVELDAAGKFVQAWGGPAPGYDWPDAEHNVFVDHKDNVWVSGTSPSGQSQTMFSDDMVLKFDNKGKLIKQIGGRSANLGSKDPTSVNKPGDIFVYPKTNEVFVADGYGNRRLIVFDADTLAYKRMWGAFGNTPFDEDGHGGGRGANGGYLAIPDPTAKPAGRGAAPQLDTEGLGSPQFGEPVHAVVVTNDDLVYVGDRNSRRFQEFTLQGKYNRQMFINRAGPSAGSVCGFALSPDKEQEFLYVADYGNSHIVVVDRKKLEVVYQFGTRGAGPGQFQGLHHIAVDSKGNLYTGEVAPGGRVQKFTFKGNTSTPPANALTAAQLAAKP